MNILVPGGAGYVGAMLVPWLLADGHKVTVLDPMWFGPGYLPDNDSLSVIKGDIRDMDIYAKACNGQDAVILLASISKEQMCQNDPGFASSVNQDSVAPSVTIARKAQVRRFIYASSVAVYGTLDGKEDGPVAPTTIYGRGKVYAEAEVMEEQTEDFVCTVTRSASVCGYSLHQRLDLTVNMMVHDACRKGVIKVNGGPQKRSHIHIHDICRAYRMILTERRETVAGQAFNFVAENQSVLETSQLVAEETGARIEIGPATDDRSYTVDGAKARKVLGFVPNKTVRDAVLDLKARFDDGYWPDSLTNPLYQNMADVS